MEMEKNGSRSTGSSISGRDRRAEREVDWLDTIGSFLVKAALLLLLLLLASQFVLQFEGVRRQLTGIDRAEGERLGLAVVILHLRA